MSLTGFQLAMADAVTSPTLCQGMSDGDPAVLDRYDLTERERRRVVAVAGQRGMTVNSTLYWANRLALLIRTMPLTCKALGTGLPAAAARYWSEAPYALLQFHAEAIRFAAHLRGPLADGALLADTIAVDLAVLDMRLSPDATAPRWRVVRVHHDPETVLGGGSGVPARVPAGEQWLLVETHGEEIAVHRVDAATGRGLAGAGPSPAGIERPETVTVLHLGTPTR